MPLTLTDMAASQSASAIASKRPPRSAIERGIVDQRVDAAERPGCGIGHIRGGFGASHVQRDADRLPVLSLYEVERRRAVVYVRSNDKSSCRRQASCEFLSEPARSARDDHDLVANG
jgi:hypothetical protein